ncbi:MAG: 3-hydroxyacyl-CoA dehydrogenase NAD-binding domain-containing protein [Bacteroidota bacterium]|nr:3-hydroxyacyl-CoA dehydrogenase NAD-binding domain-containing protein [Bacteroidota bacterium]
MISNIGIIGAGTMGCGIAQVAAQNKHKVVVVDKDKLQLEKAKAGLDKILSRLCEKERITIQDKEAILHRITFTTDLNQLSNSDLIIEAIIEKLGVKHEVLKDVEPLVKESCIIASNTSSLSIASIGSVLQKANRVIGIHFFNPAPLMPLVEIIPAVQTDEKTLNAANDLIKNWGKTVVKCKDTPGFIVNRVARPFYGESLRIYEEGIADFATIDWALTELGGFKMGPFTLMDYIGNDVNYMVTESVFKAFYYDPRFKPSFTQKRHAEAGFLGRKSGRGYFNYINPEKNTAANKDKTLGLYILNRVRCMLINEAIDAVFMNVASPVDIDLAMTKGVNYPKGLLQWADELGLDEILNQLQQLFDYYGEDRYRPNPLLRKMAADKAAFF